jgi:LCP family protein required for cell wall assembly
VSSTEEASDKSGDRAEQAAAAGSTGSAGTTPRRGRRRRVLTWVGGVLAFVLVAASATGWFIYRHLTGNIHADRTTERLLGPQSARPTVPPVSYNAENILIIGSDNRDGANSGYGDTGSGSRSDTTILLHLSADRKHVTAVSIPRDAMVRIPTCQKPDGSQSPAMLAQFNWAYSFGGTACTIRTVENLTQVRIDHFIVVDFNGFKKMVDAIGGVDVCLSQPVDDKDAKLVLPAGRQHIDGTQALGFVRVRETLGDGSDTERMARQQQFLSSLVQKSESDGVLFNPLKLYPMLEAATSSLTVDPGLDSLSKLYDLVSSLKHTPSDQVDFLTAPIEPYPADPNRDQFTQPQANQLFDEIRDDQPVHIAATASATGSASAASAQAPSAVATSSSPGPASGDAVGAPAPTASASASPSGSASASASPSAPAFPGRIANQDICGDS